MCCGLEGGGPWLLHHAACFDDHSTSNIMGCNSKFTSLCFEKFVLRFFAEAPAVLTLFTLMFLDSENLAVLW